MLNEYLALIDSEKNITSNQINRGFHLDYYEDINIMYSGKTNYNLTDDISKGINTFRKLSINIDRNLKKTDTELDAKLMCQNILQSYTFYSLLRVRKISFPNYHDKLISCKRYISANLTFLKKMSDLADYVNYKSELESIANILNSCLQWVVESEKAFERTDMFFKCYNKLGEVRTGWKNRKLKSADSSSVAETIKTHMYNCWLMAVLKDRRVQKLFGLIEYAAAPALFFAYCNPAKKFFKSGETA